MVKVGAIIQVRLGSERLPNKALLPLPFHNGPALLEHVIRRASAASTLEKVVVATTEKPADDAVQNFCERLKIACFRGPADNVLERFVSAATAHDLDIIVRLTGDNPFISPETIDYAVQQHKTAGVDYTITEGLPLGTNIEVVSLNALRRAIEKATEVADKEHVTPFVRREEGFRRQTLQLESPLSSLRLTVDYPSDYALASMLYSRLQQKKEDFDFPEIAQLLAENPWLVEINSQNSQRKAFVSENEELEEAVKMLQRGGFTRAVQRFSKAKNE